MTRFHQRVGDALVEAQTLSLGQARVRDLANGLVTEPPARRPSGVLAHQDLGVLQASDVLDVGVRGGGELLEVEGVDEDGRAPGQIAQPMAQAVQARGHHGLHGRWQGSARAGGAVLPGAKDHPRRLDDEEGVAARPARDLGGLVIVDAAAGRFADQLERLVVRERIEAQA